MDYVELALPNGEGGSLAMTILRTLTLVVFLALYVDVRAESPEARTVRIPAGTFQMGGAGGSDDELPIHAVTLSAFDLDAYEVTVADFRSFRAGYKPSEHSACEQCPATNVSWEEADAYCRSIVNISSKNFDNGNRTRRSLYLTNNKIVSKLCLHQHVVDKCKTTYKILC